MSGRATVSFFFALTLALTFSSRPLAQESTDKVKAHFGKPMLAVFAGATRVECFNIEQAPDGDVNDKDHIAGYKIIARGKERGKAFAAKLVSVLEYEKSVFGEENRCFIPHHAFRISNGKESVDVIICVTCQNLHLITRDGTGKAIKTGAAMEGGRIPYVHCKFGGNEQQIEALIKEALP